jgi:hypothetical protein
MASEPLLSGEIPSDGVLDVLREIEARRITGRIRFVVGQESGEVELVGGQIAMDQDPLPDGSDPVEALLKARSGLYAVHAVLPPLAVSQGDERERRGSLAVHVPADLMTYCEQAGLTGVLQMTNAGRVVEVVYEAGELLGIRLDGREEADLQEVFAWDQGSFRITAKTEADVRSRLPPAEDAPPAEPEDPADREPTVRFARPEPDGGPTRRYAKVDERTGREDTAQHFLRVVEMALTDVVSVREKARASVRSAPPPKARPSVRPPSARTAKPKDSTVRIVWIGGEPSIEQAVPEPLRARRPEAVAPASPPQDPPKHASSAVAPVPESARERRSEPSRPARVEPEPEALREDVPLPAPAALPREAPRIDEPTSHATILMLVLFLVAAGAITYFATR